MTGNLQMWLTTGTTQHQLTSIDFSFADHSSIASVVGTFSLMYAKPIALPLRPHPTKESYKLIIESDNSTYTIGPITSFELLNKQMPISYKFEAQKVSIGLLST